MATLPELQTVTLPVPQIFFNIKTDDDGCMWRKTKINWELMEGLTKLYMRHNTFIIWKNHSQMCEKNYIYLEQQPKVIINETPKKRKLNFVES